jgi:hypothetical protein
LARVTFESPAAFRTIERYAFRDCSVLASFVVPSSLSTLGVSSALSSVTFEPDSRLHALETLDMPDSVTTVIGSVTHTDFAMCDVFLIHGKTLLREDRHSLNSR